MTRVHQLPIRSDERSLQTRPFRAGTDLSTAGSGPRGEGTERLNNTALSSRMGRFERASDGMRRALGADHLPMRGEESSGPIHCPAESSRNLTLPLSSSTELHIIDTQGRWAGFHPRSSDEGAVPVGIRGGRVAREWPGASRGNCASGTRRIPAGRSSLVSWHREEEWCGATSLCSLLRTPTRPTFPL